MKKVLTIVSLISILCLCLSGCGAKDSTMIEKMDAKLSVANYNMAGTLRINDDEYKFTGAHQNDLTKAVLSKNDIAEYSTFISSNSDLYLKNSEEMFTDLKKSFGELEETDVEFIAINENHEKINLGNADFNILNKYLNISFRNTLNTYISQNEGSETIEDGLSSVSISGEAATKFIEDWFASLKNGANTIYDEVVSKAPADLQTKYKTSREKNITKMNTFFDSLKEELVINENAVLSVKNKLIDGVYTENVSFVDSGKNISFTITVQAAENTLTIPENIININELKPISEEEQREQLNEFYAAKYPEAAQMKTDLISIGYENPKYTTALAGVSLYATRESKSLGFDYGIVDEVVVEFLDGWLSEVTMVSCFSEKDFEMYGISALGTYIEEMEFLIDDDFLIEIGDGVGYYENILEDWEFYVTVSELNVQESGLVTVELVAKQH